MTGQDDDRASRWEKTREQLIRELDALRRRVAELEEGSGRYYDLFEHSGESIYVIDPITFKILYVNINAARRLGYGRDELVQLTLGDIEAPRRDDGSSQEFAWESTASDTVYYECLYRHKDGREIPVEVSSRPARYGQQEVLLNVVRDITARKEAERQLAEYRHHLEELVAARTVELTAAAAEAQRLNQQLEQRLAAEQALLEGLEKRVTDRTRELNTLYRVSAIAGETLPLDKTMARSLGVVLATLGGEMGAIHLRADDESPLQLVAHRGFSPQAAAGLEDQSTTTWWNQVLAGDRPLMLLNPQPALAGASAAWPPAMAAQLRACLAVPIRVQGWPAGTLSVLRGEGQEFMAEEMALLTTIADQLGTAVESDRLRRSAENARLLEERQRLARELHDAVSQSLYSLALFADAAREMGKTGQDERVSHYLERIEQTAHQALKEMRLLIYELRPSALEHGGLRSALEHRLEAVERRAGIDVTLIASGSVAVLPGPVEYALYRIAQETLNNVLRHARATAVTVRLEVADREVELAVIDNGVGFDPQIAAGGGGMGLINIRQRAEQVGGSLVLNSTPGAGTQVIVRIPTPEVG